MKAHKIVLGSAVAFATILHSCSGGDQEGEELGALDMVEEAASQPEADENRVYISVPTPSELISFINEAHESFNSDLLHTTDAAASYSDKKAKALNFGIYGTDMVYASSYNEGTEALQYFAVLSKLADELEISSAFTEEMMKKMESDLSGAEALMDVSDDTYYAAYNYLEQNDRGNTLALIIAGGWLESVYIASNLVTQFDASSPTIVRLTEQNLALENIIDFMSHHKDDAAVSDVSNQLAELLLLFEGIEEVEVKAEKKKGGRMVLGGSNETRMEKRMTQDQFNTITAKVTEVRNSIVGAKS